MPLHCWGACTSLTKTKGIAKAEIGLEMIVAAPAEGYQASIPSAELKGQ